MRLLYLIGAPGAGKTTLFRELTVGLPRVARRLPIPHLVWQGMSQVVELGVRRGAFSGTDGLAMNALPRVLAFLDCERPPLVMGEGDRLASERFFQEVQELGYVVELAYLDTPREVAEARRRRRGSRQDASWVRGREAKVSRLAEAWGARRLDGRLSPGENVERLASWSTVARALLPARAVEREAA